MNNGYTELRFNNKINAEVPKRRTSYYEKWREKGRRYPPLAIIFGLFAGLLYLWFSGVLVKNCIDDAVDAIPVHMDNGLWELIGVGLFATPEHMQNVYGNSDHVGWFYEWGRGSGNFNLMGCQLIGILFIVAWVTAIMYPLYCILDYYGLFRADALEEIVGLDLSFHGGSPQPGAPEFIKTEHLEAFEKRKEEMKQRSSIKHQSTAASSGGVSEALGTITDNEEGWKDNEPNEPSNEPTSFNAKAG